MPSPTAAAPAPAGADWLLFVAPSLIWGTTWYAIKFQLGVVAPEASVGYRFALAAALLFGWCLLRGTSLTFDRRTHAAFALLGALLYGVNYVLVYLSEAYLASGVVALLFGTMVLWNLVGARLLFGTRLTAPVVGGAALGLVGVTMVVWPDLLALGRGAGQGYGVLLALTSTVIASTGNLWSQRLFRSGVPVVACTAWSMAYGAGLVLLWCAVRGVPFTFDTSLHYLVSIAYLAVFGSIAAFITYLTLLQRIGAGRAGYTAVVIPVVAMGTSTVFEGYRWSALAAAGMALVLIGNVLILRKRGA